MKLPLALILFVTAFVSAPAADRAFPEAQGFGAFTPGGRGGKIIRVTTLAASGAGSFAAALGAKGPRIVVFEVGGVIDLAGKSLKLAEPFVTIAGQTAPAPGITLIKGTLNLMAHDVIIQHLSIRPGEAGRAKKSGWEADGISGVGASNVIVDHCSCTWAIDENLSASGERFGGDSVEDWRAHTSHHITFSNCIIAEALSKSTHGKGEHSKGSLLHDNATFLTVIGNLYASNTERNPLAKGGVHAVIVNNWISNPGRRAVHHALVDEEWGTHPHQPGRLAIVGNVLEYGANTPAKMPLFFNHGTSPLELFMDDNLAFDRERNAAPLTGGTSLPEQQVKPPWPEGLAPMPAEKVKEFVAKNAGARPWDRDPIDARIIGTAQDGSGKIIDSEQEVGGYPERPETHAPFKPEGWDLETMQRRSPLR
jgi:pectate lyase